MTYNVSTLLPVAFQEMSPLSLGRAEEVEPKSWPEKDELALPITLKQTLIVPIIKN